MYFSPFANVIPAAVLLKRGDFIVVYQRRGVQYDAQNQLLRWEGTQTVKASLVMLDRGAALFRVE